MRGDSEAVVAFARQGNNEQGMITAVEETQGVQAGRIKRQQRKSWAQEVAGPGARRPVQAGFPEA